MSKYKDFSDMIEILDRAIEVQQQAGKSFRHNSRLYESEIARSLYLEIAGDFIQFREKFQARKRKLVDALNDLKAAEENAGEVQNDVSQVKGFTADKSKDYAVSTPRDPVCDMRVNPEDCQNVAVFRGKQYYFCCSDCHKAFELTPEKYVRT